MMKEYKPYFKELKKRYKSVMRTLPKADTTYNQYSQSINKILQIR